ncbi:MAG: hypothetical protein ACPGYV_07780 [Phycisphaeraceae bacterium]
MLIYLQTGLAQAASPDTVFWCCGLFIGLFLFVFWIVELLSLMSMSDDAFPGRYDKAIWAAILIVLVFLGALLFWMWKQGRQARQLAEADVRNTLEQAITHSNKKPD